MKFRIALFACTVATLTFGASSDAHAQNPSQPYIQSITYGGSGCPQGTVGASFSNDRRSYTLIFDAFVASGGPNVPATEGRKTCQLSLNIHVPQGNSSTCMTTTHRGYMQKPGGADMSQQVLYSLDGPQRSHLMLTPREEPMVQDYITNDHAPLAFYSDRDTVSVTTMSTNLQLATPGLSAQFTTDSIDGKLGECDFISASSGPYDPGDLTPPVIQATRSVEPNANGWNKTDVTLSYTCTGNSGSPNTDSMLEPDTLTESGRAHAACIVDYGGVTLLSYHFADIDKVAPTVAATSPASGLYGLNSVVSTAGSCSDDNSGIASCTAAATLNTSSTGAKTFTATATDRAGNVATASVPYSVGGKDECKSGGYADFLVPTFKNQGQCVSTYAGKK